MKFGYKSLFAGMSALALLAGPANAHNLLWINVVPEFDRQVIASLGYGDSMSSGSELLTPDWWPVTIEDYTVVDPSGKRTPLGAPEPVTQKKQTLSSGMTFQAEIDTGRRKFVTNADAEQGTYQIVAKTHVTHVQVYEGKEGNSVFINTAIDKLPKGAKVTGEGYNVLLAKGVFTAGEWTMPAPIGLPLEVVPLSDLQKAKPGDKVRFKVLMNGEPLLKETQIVAYNASFGDTWGLASPLVNGVGEFRIPVAGPWRVSIGLEGKTTEFDAYKDKKDTVLVIESSLVFNTKP
ncbi:DUF4198 domain-containing protein [Kordiimonas pumila]|uniref:DUF4198 domain-containing protein n=1 Tax=Kordiimonas pumila TaxID=2161677 RepID=A0ABV7D6Q4_9PROT|nr:DUF4198 domain-containing protein [Kordiimonas pumila]